MHKFSFVFVAQAGKLEGMSLLLAATIRWNMGFDVELIAAVPTPAVEWGVLSDLTLRGFRELEVRVTSIDNPFGLEYPIGNKFSCLSVSKTNDRLVFLDTDIVMLRSILDRRLFGSSIAAVNATHTHCPIHIWEKIYERFELECPTEKVDGSLHLFPYYNSGMISIDFAEEFGETWSDCASIIDNLDFVPNSAKRPFLDQIAFPIAAKIFDTPVLSLPNKFNFPSWSESETLQESTIFYHYQRPKRLLREYSLFSKVAIAVEQYPQTQIAVGANHHVKLFSNSSGYQTKRKI